MEMVVEVGEAQVTKRHRDEANQGSTIESMLSIMKHEAEESKLRKYFSN